MAFAYALDPTTPPGGEAASLGDDRIREFKNAIVERVNSRFVSIEGDPWIIKSPVSGGNTQSLIPTADNTYALGSASLRFSDLRAFTAAISPTGRLYFDNAGDTYISEVSANTLDVITGGITTLRMQLAGVTSFSDFFLTAAKRFYLDGGGDTYMFESVANQVDLFVGANLSARFIANALVILSASRFYLDGGGDTYIYESVANVISFVVGGSNKVNLTTTQLSVAGVDIVLEATRKFYLDGGGDTYISETAANVMRLTAGAVNQISLDTTQVVIDGALVQGPTKRHYFDSGFDTYVLESSANILDFFAGGGNVFRISNGAGLVSVLAIDLAIPSAKRLYFDGAGDTYMVESGANQLDTVVGGATIFRHNAANSFFLGHVVLPAAKIFYMDGGSDTYFTEASADTMRFFTGASDAFDITTTLVQVGAGRDLIIQATKRFYLDGGGDTYFIENAANHVQIFIGTVINAEFGAGTAAGDVNFPNLNSAAAANPVYISTPTGASTSGRLTYAVSSELYKRDIADLTIEEAARTIFGARAVNYRSAIPTDDSSVLYTGFIAEELHKVGSQYVYAPDDVPQSVDYARLVVPLTLVAQNHEARIRSLEALTQ